MTHRILLREAVLDVPSAVVGAERDFWAAALLATPRGLGEGHEEFVALDGAASLPFVGLQDIGADTPRVHLDVETDDVDAEVARLQALGAEVVARRGWVVLRDPAGLLFCVVRVESPDFATRSRVVG